jgi:hypothetical protein
MGRARLARPAFLSWAEILPGFLHSGTANGAVLPVGMANHRHPFMAVPGRLRMFD